jgi:hypothetical protein
MNSRQAVFSAYLRKGTNVASDIVQAHNVGRSKQEQSKYRSGGAHCSDIQCWMLGITIALHHLGHFKMCITAGEMQTLLLRRVPLAAISSTSGRTRSLLLSMHSYFCISLRGRSMFDKLLSTTRPCGDRASAGIASLSMSKGFVLWQSIKGSVTNSSANVRAFGWTV